MKGKIIIPSWSTLQSKGLLSVVRRRECIRKIVFVNYLHTQNPELKEYIDGLLQRWPSSACLTQKGYKQLRKYLKNRLRRFSDNGIHIILEGEEEDDNV